MVEFILKLIEFPVPMTQRFGLRGSKALPPLPLNPLIYGNKRPCPYSYIEEIRRKIVIFDSQIHGNGLGPKKLNTRINSQELTFLRWSQPPHEMATDDSSAISFGNLRRNAFLDIALELSERITLSGGKRNEDGLTIDQAMGIWNTPRRLIGPRLRSKCRN